MPREQCQEVSERQCETVEREECSDVPRSQCNEVSERQCRSFPKQECHVSTYNLKEGETVNGTGTFMYALSTQAYIAFMHAHYFALTNLKLKHNSHFPSPSNSHWFISSSDLYF